MSKQLVFAFMLFMITGVKKRKKRKKKQIEKKLLIFDALFFIRFNKVK